MKQSALGLLALILSFSAAAQGKAADIGGYYAPDAAKAAQAMRPSETFNQALAKL